MNHLTREYVTKLKDSLLFINGVCQEKCVSNLNITKK